jgi:2-(1,2-epoxy-1,2-dihydrophenyl)acetyl-CoA isomerase
MYDIPANRFRRLAMPHPPLTSMECTVSDGLARVVLNQPDRGNPIDGPFCRELNALVTELSDRADVRAVLVTARGKYFSVGGDIKAFSRERAQLSSIVKSWTGDLHLAIARLMRMNAPVIAAVQGGVAGGSVSLVASADIVFAATDVRFSAAFPAIGFSADSGSTITLSQRMGFARAKRFLLLAESLDAAEAQAAGLVDFVTAPDDLMKEAEATALKLAAGPTLAYGGIKQTMLRARTQGLESQLEDEAQTLAAIARSDDAWEGINAFRERRPAAFQGK